MARSRASQLIPDHEGAAGFLPWVIAVMVFVGGLAVAASFILNKSVSDIHAGLKGSITVEVPRIDNKGNAGRVEQAAGILRSTAGIAQVRVLDKSELIALLEPWLGKGNVSDDLPIPQLIDVTLDRDHPADLAFLERRLQKDVPGARLDDHKLRLRNLDGFAAAIKWLAVGTIVMVIGAIALIVAFAARASLASHRDIVELLHLIGAHDSFVAEHFQKSALKLGLKGGIIGLFAAAAAVLALTTIAGGWIQTISPAVSLDPLYILLMVLLPVIATGVSVLTVRLTVMRTLHRMP